MEYSKKYKLPKSQWEKGKSKFVFCRMMEDKGIKFVKSVSELEILGWWQRIKNFIKRLTGLGFKL